MVSRAVKVKVKNNQDHRTLRTMSSPIMAVGTSNTELPTHQVVAPKPLSESNTAAKATGLKICLPPMFTTYLLAMATTATSKLSNTSVLEVGGGKIKMSMKAVMYEDSTLAGMRKIRASKELLAIQPAIRTAADNSNCQAEKGSSPARARPKANT